MSKNNLPTGASDDPNAPWNESEGPTVEVYQVDFDTESLMIQLHISCTGKWDGLVKLDFTLDELPDIEMDSLSGMPILMIAQSDALYFGDGVGWMHSITHKELTEFVYQQLERLTS